MILTAHESLIYLYMRRTFVIRPDKVQKLEDRILFQVLYFSCKYLCEIILRCCYDMTLFHVNPYRKYHHSCQAIEVIYPSLLIYPFQTIKYTIWPKSLYKLRDLIELGNGESLGACRWQCNCADDGSRGVDAGIGQAEDQTDHQREPQAQITGFFWEDWHSAECFFIKIQIFSGVFFGFGTT